MTEGKFREDLYYRLNVMPIFLPPLRERGHDAIQLAKFFIAGFNKEYRKKVAGISAPAQDFLLKYTWPGNVRELKNVIERVLIVNDVHEILPEHLPEAILSKMVKGPDSAPTRECSIQLPVAGLDFNEFIGKMSLDVKRQIISQAMKRTDGNKTRAARLLGLSRSALGRQLEKIKTAFE